MIARAQALMVLLARAKQDSCVSEKNVASISATFRSSLEERGLFFPTAAGKSNLGKMLAPI